MKILDSIYRYTYTVGMWVFGISLVVYALAQGIAPFGLQASWTEGGLGNSFVVTQSVHGTSAVGDKVAAAMPIVGQVSVATVEGTTRHDGELMYRVSGTEAGSLVRAWDVEGSVLATVPFVGVLVRTLHHPVGLAALIGVPFFMLVLNILMFVSLPLRNVLAQLRRMQSSVKMRSLRRKARPIVAEVEEEHDEVLEEYTPAPVQAAMEDDMSAYRVELKSRAKRIAVENGDQSSNFVKNIGGVFLPQQHSHA